MNLKIVVISKMQEQPEVQIVNYNKQYEINLNDHDILSVEYDSKEQKDMFEKVLICKIYGIKYTLSTTPESISYDNYNRIEYNIFYGSGSEPQGDVSKCIFGIVSGFKAYKTETSTEAEVKIEAPYMFIFAHKTAKNDDETDVNVLRIHKIIIIPNSHSVDPPGTVIPEGFSGCGLFAGDNGIEYCILGFKKENSDWYFHLPSYSYCLEGRTENIINLGNDYKGKFKVAMPVLNQDTDVPQ